MMLLSASRFGKSARGIRRWAVAVASLPCGAAQPAAPVALQEEYAPLYDARGMGLTTWSPLASGILTGGHLSRPASLRVWAC